MITPEPPAGSEHYREGWRHGYEQAAIDRERSADAVRLVPDDGSHQARILAHEACEHERKAWRRGYDEARAEFEQPAAAVPDTGQADDPLRLRWEVQQLQGIVQDQHRGIAAVRSLCADAMKLPTLEDPRPADDRVSPRTVLAALDRAGAVPDTGQDREPRPVYPQVWCNDSSGPNGIGGTCVLGPGHLHRDGLGGEWPVEPSGDTVQTPAVADLAYARSEVDKWLAGGDPYCILPTRTEHIPALLARLDELEGTR